MLMNSGSPLQGHLASENGPLVFLDIRRDCNASIILKKHILEREVEKRIVKPENILLLILMSENTTRLIYSTMAEASFNTQ